MLLSYTKQIYFLIAPHKIFGDGTNFDGSNASRNNKTEQEIQQENARAARIANWASKDQPINP
jgi:hypothetical protein